MLLQEKLDGGSDGISARDVWQNLEKDLRSVRYSYREIAKAIAANDESK